ncbi:MAG: hypothetical protein LM590_01865 [Thermofilum sp.]|nr:hypothetical protein [Thermofilum sp.]
MALEDVASRYQLCTFWLRYPGPIAIGPTLFTAIFTAISGAYGIQCARTLIGALHYG